MDAQPYLTQSERAQQPHGFNTALSAVVQSRPRTTG